MKTALKTILVAAAFVTMTAPALAKEVVRTETTTDTHYVTIKDDYASKNTTNRATGRHYSSFSNDYRQPESLANAQVIALQQELKLQGFYEGKIDGLLGAETKEAVRAYQEANNMRVTGSMNTAMLEDMGIFYDPATTTITTTTVSRDIR